MRSPRNGREKAEAERPETPEGYRKAWDQLVSEGRESRGEARGALLETLKSHPVFEGIEAFQNAGRAELLHEIERRMVLAGHGPAAIIPAAELDEAAPIRFEVPIRTVSGMNVRENHFVRAERVKREKRATLYRMPKFELKPVVVVTLTRVSKGELDSDAVPPACKGIRDAIASRLRVDDGCKLFEWKYRQEKGPKPMVKVEIQFP